MLHFFAKRKSARATHFGSENFFDQHQLDKTSCMAQELPDRSCRFYIGLKEITHPNVSKACEQVLADLGGEIVTEPYSEK